MSGRMPVFNPSESADLATKIRRLEDYCGRKDVWDASAHENYRRGHEAIERRLGTIEAGMQGVLVWIGAQKVKWGVVMAASGAIGGFVIWALQFMAGRVWQ